MGRRRVIALCFGLLVILTIGASTVSAWHLKEGQVCDASTAPPASKCAPLSISYDYVGCHYYCTGATPIPAKVPQSPGPELQESVLVGGENLAYLSKLRQGPALTPEKANEIISHEYDLAKHYDNILKVDPKNFWGNYDYAALRLMQKDYSAADQLYYNAFSTLDPNTRKELIADLKMPAIEKLRLREEPTPTKSSFLSKIGEGIRESAKRREAPESDPDSEKLTWIEKTAKKVTPGLYTQYNEYKRCVKGERGVGGCVVDNIVGVKN